MEFCLSGSGGPTNAGTSVSASFEGGFGSSMSTASQPSSKTQLPIASRQIAHALRSSIHDEGVVIPLCIAALIRAGSATPITIAANNPSNHCHLHKSRRTLRQGSRKPQLAEVATTGMKKTGTTKQHTTHVTIGICFTPSVYCFPLNSPYWLRFFLCGPHSVD